MKPLFRLKILIETTTFVPKNRSVQLTVTRVFRHEELQYDMLLMISYKFSKNQEVAHAKEKKIDKNYLQYCEREL